jgi:hypothetical protein
MRSFGAKGWLAGASGEDTHYLQRKRKAKVRKPHKINGITKSIKK